MKSTTFLILLLLALFTNCSSSKEATTSMSQQFYDIYIYADRSKTSVSFSAEKLSTQKDVTMSVPASPISVELNGKALEQEKYSAPGKITYTGSIEGYQSQNQLVVTDSVGRQHKYGAYLEPLDFQTKSDVILSRTETSSLPLSRAVREEEVWLFYSDNQGGGFKQVAKLNQLKDALIPDFTERLWVGGVIIELVTAKYEEVERSNSPKARVLVQYKSTIPARVVKNFQSTTKGA